MNSTRADIVLRAHAAGAGLTNEERIALGVTLVMTVLTPSCHMKVAYAASRMCEHAEALRDAHDNGFAMAEVAEVDVPLLRGPVTERADQGTAATHMNSSFRPPEVTASGHPDRAGSSSLRAVRDWFSKPDWPWMPTLLAAGFVAIVILAGWAALLRVFHTLLQAY